MALESYIIDMIEGRRRGKKILSAAGCLYGWGMNLRNFGYDKKWLKSFSVPIPVVSIGNIVSGGTGKTPLVRKLAEELLIKHKVAILTRGYRSKIERSRRIVNICKGCGPLVLQEECGDEPYWLAKHLPKAHIWVGSDRAKAAHQAHLQGAEIILLDDGMQHRRLERDIEIVVMDAQDLFGKGCYLPGGYLRDNPERLRAADLIVINRVQNEAHYELLKQQLEPYTGAPVVGMRTILKDIPHKKVGLFCGIGNPERFVESVKAAGVDIVATHFTPDHTGMTDEGLKDFSQNCQSLGAEILVCTEKDAVKLRTGCCLPILPLEATSEIVSGNIHWHNLLERIGHERRI